jgi:hypothetical protein
MRSVINHLFILCIVGFSSILKSQTNSVSKDNWRPVFIQPEHSNTLNGVSFFKKSVPCSDKTIIVFKLVNTNSTKVKISWKNNNKEYSTIIEASGNIGGSCEEFNKSDDFAKTLSILDGTSLNDSDIFSFLTVEQ